MSPFPLFEMSSSGMVFSYALVLVAFTMTAGYWQVFAKADRHGWECLVPGYNLVALTRIIGRPRWWALGFLPGPAFCWVALDQDSLWWWGLAIPSLTLLALVHGQTSFDLARSFNRSRRFAWRLTLLPIVYVAILGADYSEYAGPSANRESRKARRLRKQAQEEAARTRHAAKQTSLGAMGG